MQSEDQAQTGSEAVGKTAPAARLSLGQKLAYGVGDTGSALTYFAVNTWLLYFLINIAGLSPLAAGVTFVVGRTLDAFSVSLIGMISDRYRPRFGRLVWVRWGMIPLGTAFVLLWVLPLATWGAFLLSILAFVLFSLFYAAVSIPYVSLLPDLAPSYDERTSLNSVRMSFAVFATLLAVAAPPAIVIAATGAEDLAVSPASGWLVMGLVFGALTVAAFACTGFLVREPRRAATTSETPAPVNFREIGTAWRTPGFRPMFISFLLLTLGTMIVNSMLPFYLESVLRLDAGLQPLVLGAAFLVAILCFYPWSRVSTRLSKRSGLVAGATLYAGSLILLTTIVPTGGPSAALWIVTALLGVGMSALFLFPWSMLPDVVEFDELRVGRRREGVFYGVFVFGQKVAGSLGVFSNALVVAIFGYQQGSVEQSAETLRGLTLMLGPAAAVVMILSALALWRYPITRQSHEQAQAALEVRRQAATGSEPPLP